MSSLVIVKVRGGAGGRLPVWWAVRDGSARVISAFDGEILVLVAVGAAAIAALGGLLVEALLDALGRAGALRGLRARAGAGRGGLALGA